MWPKSRQTGGPRWNDLSPAHRKVLAALQGRLRWRRPITNATLIQHQTYSSGGRGFERLLASCAGDFRCFLGKLRGLSPRAFSRPHQEEFDALLDQL